jgi:hypothetical protein
MQDWLLAVIIGVACGALIASKLASRSEKEMPIRGVGQTRLLHYVACTFAGSSTPFVISSIILGVPFLTMFLTALSFLGLGFLTLLGYASQEDPTVVDKSTYEVKPALD